MDILSHTFSGLAIGACATQFAVLGKRNQIKIIILSGLAGFLPDLDVVSMWSGFDSFIGKWFDLKELGKEIYHKKYWYSHHGFLHSLLSSLLFTLVVASFQFKKLIKRMHVTASLKKSIPLAISVFLSYNIHLWEDMITPYFTWGGVAYVFPINSYWGGKGFVWWWNNYDLFLIIFLTFIFGMVALLFSWLLRKKLRNVVVIILFFSVLLFCNQVSNRSFDFQYHGFSEHHEVWQNYELQSKKLQKEILGDHLYEVMEWFDNQLPIWF